MTLSLLRRLSDAVHADRFKIERCWCNVRVRDGESEIAYIETYGAESDNGEEEIQGAYIAAVLEAAPHLLKIAEAAQSIFDHAYMYIDTVIGAPTEQFEQLEKALKELEEEKDLSRNAIKKGGCAFKSYITLSGGFWDHPKTAMLKRALGLEGVFAVMKLWCWAGKNRPDGVLTRLDADGIEYAAQWKGERGKLFSTLVRLRWIDEKDGVFSIHNWEKYNA
jgi:hypothetical protein